ncbi:MAG: hypothetical protein ACK42C_00780 [Aquificaceae bacterium]|jgi:hypothetical protein|uniref:hypothetical protein n=1 Tax=Hydrogenobacter sp. Uz 6-8 TaxID=3384828 RepID=UPI000F27B549|nr:MAG: hypothetical protein D6804_01585 [Aquificota bacterium]
MVKYFLLLFAFVVFSSAQEDEILIKTPLTKRLEEFNVSIGVVSIDELKKTFPRAYSLLEKHNGVPAKHDTHHLAVAIWKKQGDKIVYLSDFKVEAEVRSPILRAQKRELHKYPHTHGDNFGGWFQMAERGLYSINVYIKDSKGKTWKVNYDYMLQ